MIKRLLQAGQPGMAAQGVVLFEELLEAAPDAFVIADRHGAIVLVNRRTEEMFGYSREELLGQAVEILLPARFHDAHLGHRANFMEQPRTRAMGSGMDLFARHKSGLEFPAEVSLSPIRTAEESFIISVIRDVSERKRTQTLLARQAAELARSNAELEAFAYVASHDLQEPLRMVTSYLQLLARRYQHRLDADADEFIQFAVDGAARMKNLIEGLLTYSRVTRHGQGFVDTDCNEVLRAVLTDLKFAIADAQARVEAGDLPAVLGDSPQLRQLLQHLISNSLKFRSERQPEIRITARQRGDEWLFSVRDNGIGIAPAYLERIFVIFQRLHAHKDYPGTGIGLAVCRRIVEWHGGRIWVESEEGRGAVFYFTVPVRKHGELAGE